MKTRSHKLALLAGTVLIGLSAAAVAFKSIPTQEYTLQESRDKLAKIAKALQLYRQEAGIKPLEQWNVPADAGLPPLMTVLAKPGHPWSIPLETFKLPKATPPHPQRKSDFAQIYLPPGVQLDKDSPYNDFANTLKRRGEKLPIMGDFYLGQLKQYKELQPRQFTLVLRLDGTIEVVEHSGIYGELLEK